MSPGTGGVWGECLVGDPLRTEDPVTKPRYGLRRTNVRDIYKNWCLTTCPLGDYGTEVLLSGVETEVKGHKSERLQGTPPPPEGHGRRRSRHLRDMLLEQ